MSDAVPSLALVCMYIGLYMAGDIYHWAYLPWWVTTVCGFRKQKPYIWAGGIVLGCMFNFLTWKVRLGHCIMNIGRMLKHPQHSMMSWALSHGVIALILLFSGEDEVSNLYVDVLAGVSAVVMACLPDNMSWFSIGMLFTNPWSTALCVIHAFNPWWYEFYKNNHYRKVKYSTYYVYPILIMVGLLFREEISAARQYTV